MAWIEGENPLYSPKKCGLSIISILSDPNANYSFDDIVVWQTLDDKLYYAQDSGCSCPVPFENHTDLDSLTEIGKSGWNTFERDVNGHCSSTQEKIDFLSEIRSYWVKYYK